MDGLKEERHKYKYVCVCIYIYITHLLRACVGITSINRSFVRSFDRSINQSIVCLFLSLSLSPNPRRQEECIESSAIPLGADRRVDCDYLASGGKTCALIHSKGCRDETGGEKEKEEETE